MKPETARTALEQRGPVAALQMVKERQPKVSVNLFWAFESGLKEQDWRERAESTRQRLLKEPAEI